MLMVPCGLDDKEPACNAGDQGSIPGQEDPLEKKIISWYYFFEEDIRKVILRRPLFKAKKF